jgi:hypothetical protein
MGVARPEQRPAVIAVPAAIVTAAFVTNTPSQNNTRTTGFVTVAGN